MNKIRQGDVFALISPKGKIFLQVVKIIPKEPELVRVLNGLHDAENIDINKIVNKEEQFSVFFDAEGAFKSSIIEYVGNFDIPNQYKIPSYMRSAQTDKDGKLLYWHIIDVNSYQRMKVQNLTKTQRKLSPYGVWNDTLLVDRVTQGWTLQNWKN